MPELWSVRGGEDMARGISTAAVAAHLQFISEPSAGWPPARLTVALGQYGRESSGAQVERARESVRKGRKFRF